MLRAEALSPPTTDADSSWPFLLHLSLAENNLITLWPRSCSEAGPSSLTTTTHLSPAASGHGTQPPPRSRSRSVTHASRPCASSRTDAILSSLTLSGGFFFPFPRGYRC
uniref:Uncharacterized protein n=1 Tax=Anopheles albimanus TaxID=7167 RepID=A0A182FYY1_ANOAL